MNLKKTIILAALLLQVSMPGLQARGFDTFGRYEKEISDTVSRAGLPSSFVYLPLVITGCNPDWTGSYGAGAWAISGPVARHYGLVVGASYDERLDMKKCTGAAVAYLKDLYAQNGGRVEDVLKQYFNCIHRHDYASAPAEVLGMLEQMRADCRDNHEPGDVPMGSVTLKSPVLLGEFAQAVDVPLPQLMRWNPALRYASGLLPQGAVMCVPKDKVRSFDAREKNLYASAKERAKKEQTPLDRSRSGVRTSPADSLTAGTPVRQKPVSTAPAKPRYTSYTVKKGDNLGSIARKFKTSVSKIVKDNRLKSADKIREGQVLKIYKSK